MPSRFPFPVLSVAVLIISMLACSLPGAAPASPSGSVPSGGAGSAACANPLYPVAVGASWTYSFNGSAPGNFTRSISAVSPDGFSDQDVFSSGLTRTGEWKCNAGALIALKPGGGSDATVQSSNIDSTFQTTAMEGVTLPAVVNAGDTWSQNFTMEGTETVNGQVVASKSQAAYSCSAGGAESVTVPAGTFTAIRTECQTSVVITITMNGIEVPANTSTTSTIWYAAGVGMIKTDSLISGGDSSTIELTAYNIP